MPLLPYAKLVIESPLAPAGAVAALAEHVEPRRMLRWPGGATLDFEGGVDDAGFHVRRIIRYRNAFRPEVHGVIEAAPGGSRIVVTIRMHDLALVFCVIWMMFAGVLAGGMASASLHAGALDPFALIPLGMILAVWAMVAGGFTYEATRVRRRLVEILRGRELP